MSETKLGLGLAALGRPEYINIRQQKNIDKSLEAFHRNASTILDLAYSEGIRYFDTAPSYGKGESFLTEWNAKNNYPNVMLSTKWGYTYKANWQLGYKDKHEIKEHSLTKLKEQWQTSKVLLPNLKIYQVHSATLESGILENNTVLEELHKLKKENNLKIGISTSGVNQKKVIEKALAITIDNEPLFDSFQVTFNILEQTTKPILELLKKNNKTIIIKEALANGRVFKQLLLNEDVTKIQKKYNVGIDAIALRFVMDSLNPTVVLSGASTKKQLLENLKVNDFVLTNNEIIILQKLQMDAKNYWEDRNALSWV